MNKRTHHLEVALLLADMKDVQDVSAVFRQAGVIPHFYEDLKTFWREVTLKAPTLCVVDVRKMSEGDLVFKNHPMIAKNILPVAFVYSNETSPLLYSTYEIFNLGLLNTSLNFKGQVKSLLWRVNKELNLENKIRSLEYSETKVQRQLGVLDTAFVDLKERRYYDERLKEICGDFERAKLNGSDFFDACEKVFSGMKEVAEFSYLELSHNGQKLVSPKSFVKKFRMIPALWLGKACPEGIEYFAQKMASEVTVETLGSDLMQLQIRGTGDLPEKLIFIRTETEEFLNSFNWSFLEIFLCGIYGYFKIRNHQAMDSSRFVGPWELFSVLDSYLYGKTAGQNLEIDKDISLIDVDFSLMVEVIKSKPHIRFHWKNFIYDFVSRLEGHTKVDFRVSCLGVDHLALVVEKRIGEAFFKNLKGFVERFSYWRYFEESELILTKEMMPLVKMVPLSSSAYLRLLDGYSVFIGEGQKKREELPVLNRESTETTSLKSNFKPLELQ